MWSEWGRLFEHRPGWEWGRLFLRTQAEWYSQRPALSVFVTVSYCARNSFKFFNGFEAAVVEVEAVAVAISISPQQMQSKSFSDFFSIEDKIYFNFLRF